MDMFKLDNWQEQVMEYNGNVTIRSGRQVGKSTVIAMKAKQFAETHDGTVVLVIAAAQRQSSYIFEKIKGEFDRDNDIVLSKRLKIFKKNHKRLPTPIELKTIQCDTSSYEEPPTQTRIILKNGSRLYSLPAGRTGAFIRGLAIDLLIADEAAYIPEVEWNAVLPMIGVSRKVRGLGWIILLSTPFGKGGYFYNSHHDDDFRQFHISSERCVRMDKAFLMKEKERMTKAEYAQEYLGEFIDEWNQFFPTQLIKKCMTFIDYKLERGTSCYLGVDIARYGRDESAFVISELDRKKNIKIVKVLTTQNMPLTDTVGRIIALDREYKFRKIFVDDAGIGGGVMDMLIEKIGRRAVGLNNSSRSIDKEGIHRKRILKEDMYSNSLMMMESGKLEMINDIKLLKSLKSIVFEYTAEKNLKLYGDYAHVCEAFVRASWCIRNEGLKVFIG